MLHQKLKDYRVFSICMAIFTSCLLYDVVQWAMNIYTEDITINAAAYVTGIITALVALVKMTYTFAANRSESNPLKDNQNNT